MIKFINKKSCNLRNNSGFDKKRKQEEVKTEVLIEEKPIEETAPVKPQKKNNKKDKNKEINTEESMDNTTLQQAEMLVNALNGVEPERIKKVKSEKGLFERTESSKIYLTEDNRQILND